MSDDFDESGLPSLSLPTITVGVNSYLTLADALAIADERLFTRDWDCADDVTRCRAILTATAILNRMSWEGRPLAPTQPLAWPRVPQGCPSGYPLTTEVPAAIITATAELAFHLLERGEMERPAIMQRMLGQSMAMYFPTIADELPKHIRRLIEPYLRSSSANVAEVIF